MASSPLVIDRAEALPQHGSRLLLLGASDSTLGRVDAELTALVVELGRERARVDALLCSIPASTRHIRGIARHPTSHEAKGAGAAAPWPLASARPALGALQFLRPRLVDLVRFAAQALATPRTRAYAIAAERRSKRRQRARGSLVLPIGLLCAGTALSADAAVSVVWQEPLSALYASHQQRVLAADFSRLQKLYATSPLKLRRGVSQQQRLAALAQRLERSSRAGQPIGRINARSIGMNFVVVQGTDTTSLTKGPGHYRGTTLPGAPGTAAVAGHRTTFLAPFRRVAELRRGAPLVFTMPYGRFTYVVLGQRVVSPTDVSVLNRVAGTQGSRLVLTTCDPLYSAARRRVIIAKLTSATPTGAGRA